MKRKTRTQGDEIRKMIIDLESRNRAAANEFKRLISPRMMKQEPPSPIFADKLDTTIKLCGESLEMLRKMHNNELYGVCQRLYIALMDARELYERPASDSVIEHMTQRMMDGLSLALDLKKGLDSVSPLPPGKDFTLT